MSSVADQPPPPGAVGAAPAPSKTAPPMTRVAGRTRDRYIDGLGAAALIGVVFYHIFGWVWLPAFLPSMGIMFALAGSLIAGSLDRSPGNPWRVLAKRTRRLLPPLWLMGVIIVPTMIWHGWTYSDVAGVPLHWWTLLLWILPISDPPGSAWAEDFVVPLWYISAYLWCLLLSPMFLWMFRRWPKRIIAVPLVSLAMGTLGILSFRGRSGDVILTMSIFGACWMLGFAHHDNTLRSIPLRKIVPLGVALLATGLGWALTHSDPRTSWDMADALYGLGVVLLLLRFYPDFSWVSRRPALDKIVTVVNSRAMTIYLWSNVAIFCATPLANSWGRTAAWNAGMASQLEHFILTWILISLAIFLFGWVEDLAAGQPVQINPWRCRSRIHQAAHTRRVRTAPTVVLRPTRLRIGTIPLVGITAVVSVLSLATVAWQYGPGRPEHSGESVPAESKSSLPPHVVSGYWQSWGNPKIQLRDVPAQYNLIFAAFAVADGAGTGRVKFEQQVQSQESLISDIDALYRAGRRVSLSVGGADDGGLRITTPSQKDAFLATVTKIVDLYHFQGVDWDLEHGIDHRTLADVSRQLKAKYGPAFLITMAPLQDQPDYEALAVEIKDILDMVNPQFYNGGQATRTYILSQARHWASKIDADKVGMGFMTVQKEGVTGVLPTSEVAATWRDLVHYYPRARGLMTWSINLDSTSGYQFVKTCSPLMGGVPGTLPGSRQSRGLDVPAKKEIAMQIVSSNENSSLNWRAQYTYITDIHDGRGYTGGIVGFCSGTGDMLDLVKYYKAIKPGNVLAQYIPALEAVNGTPSHYGLDPYFVRDWQTAAADPSFQRAQDDERDRVYFNPAVSQGKSDGLGTLGQFIYYDALVMHGSGNDSDQFDGIRATAMENAKTPAQGGNEVIYLNAFLDARRDAMLADPSHRDNIDRVDTEQRSWVEQGNLNLDTPLSWEVTDDSFHISKLTGLRRSSTRRAKIGTNPR